MMRLWKVVVLLNVALALGIGLGYLRWAKEVRSLRDEVSRLRAETTRPDPQSWTVRGIVRSVIPKLGAIFLTHEAMAGLMDAMTMGFETEDPTLLDGLAPGDAVRFTVRRDGERLVVIAIEKLRAP
ncbi:MAG TPA: copper-binding protein [Methylomirabilota bacterium]|jgi:Cu/Ag efflux protein CusF|nr:copper-binding protein [Methylomirabilota bacterium]